MKKIFHALLFLSLVLPAAAQEKDGNDPVIFEIAGEKIHKSEFMKDFLRSIGKSPEAAPTACTYEKRQKLEEYVDLFVNFRVKLADAYAMGLDKEPSLVKELASYRSELAAPYLMDSATVCKIMEEAYDRNHYALHAAHILIRLMPNATADDTLKAYEMAQEAYRRAAAGEEFFALANEMVDRQIAPEERSRIRRTEREGELGCFSAFDMVYPFESAAYALEPGQVSQPVKTRFGYHVIKLFDKVPYYGKTTLRHIWVSRGNKPEKAEARIRLAYSKLQEGMSFEEVAKNYSDDIQTNDKGGLLNELPLNQMPPEYVSEIAKGMKEGSFSDPFLSPYGWHIIQLVKRDTIPPLDDLVPLYKQRLSHDKRNNEPQEVFVEKTLQKYHFVDYTQTYGTWKKQDGSWVLQPAKKYTIKNTYATSLTPVVSIITDSVFKKRWIYDTTLLERTPLMELDGRRYTLDDLCRYIAYNQSYSLPFSHEKYVADKYKKFIGATLMDYADSQLEVENSDFKDLMDEYRHGLMIFAYNDKQIWSKAITDTVGFNAYYEESSRQRNFDNEDDAPYFWNSRARVCVVTVGDSASLHPDKAMKIVQKGVKKGWSSAELQERLAEKLAKGSNNALTVRLDMLEDGKQNVLNDSEWHNGIYLHPEEHGYTIYNVLETLPITLKNQSEARGYYINDYQNELERRLIEQLRKQYNVVIHQDVIDAITY